MKTTREGKRFVIASILIAVAAVNTGNNLIYLILSLMLSFICLSFLLLKINLSGLSITVSVTPPVFAGEECTSVIRIENRKRFIPAYSIHLRAGEAFLPVYCIVIPSRGKANMVTKVKFLRRGLYAYDDFVLQSGFPYILVNSTRHLDVSGNVLVYPALGPVEHLLPEFPDRDYSDGLATTGSGNEIYSIRDFRYGDDWKRVHWKASAKTANLLVKEYADHDFKKTTIVLDNLNPLFVLGDGRRRKEAQGRRDAFSEIFEKAVSLAASLSKYFLDSEHYVRLLSCNKVIPFGNGEEQLYKILDILAVINEEEDWNSPVEHDREGLLISVLKSRKSHLFPYSSFSDLVIYADTV